MYITIEFTTICAYLHIYISTHINIYICTYKMVLPPFPSQRFLRSLASVVDEPLPDLPAWLTSEPSTPQSGFSDLSP